jgi:phosphoribosylformimino-5-aminoimidazole carboxamide ribotide isomerase
VASRLLRIMSNTFRILPAIDLLDGECVRLERGDRDKKTVYGTDAAAMARRWHDAGASALHVVDLNGAFDGAPGNLEHVAAIRRNFPGFIEVGGGLRDAESVEALLSLDINCAILGTAALEDQELLKRLIADGHGDKLAVGVDARDGMVSVRGWTETGKVAALDLLAQLAELGIKRAIFTDIATDGMLTGPNLKATEEVARHVPGMTIIQSGGISSAADVEAVSKLPVPNIGGVISGKALYAGKLDLAAALKFERA